ncbi:MAG: hypothetical protein ACXWP4_26520 [Polyangiales bacterium]
MRRILLALALFSAPLAACKGKAPKSAIGWEQKTPYAKGTVFKHVPASCVGGWIYIDLPAVLKNEATATTAEGFASKIAHDFGKSGGKRATKELEAAFKEEGFAPLRDTKEIAVCYRGDESTLFVFGGDYSGKDLLGALQRAVERSGDEPPKIENVRGVPTISLGKLSFTRVAPNVLVMGEDVVAAARLSKPFDRSAEWGFQPDRILVASLSGPDRWRISVAESGPDIEIFATSRSKQSQAELEKVRDRVAKRLEDTPLKLLSQAVSTTKIDVAAGQASYSLRVPSLLIADAVRIIADLPPGETKRILGYLFAPESNEQKI